jgi:hypothetical protein
MLPHEGAGFVALLNEGNYDRHPLERTTGPRNVEASRHPCLTRDAMLTMPSTMMHGTPAQEDPPLTCRPHPDALLKALGEVGFCLRGNRDGGSSRSARHAALIGGPRHECYLWGTTRRRG